MKRLTSNDLAINGLKQLNFLDEFVYYHQYGSHDFHKDIENFDFKYTNNRFVGQDLMDSETTYKRISEHQKKYNNLEYQINQLEDRFKIKITYIQKNEY